MKKKNIVIIVILAVLLIGFGLCTFQLNENESAAVLRFGRIVSVYVKTQAAAQNVTAGLSSEDARLVDITVHYGTGLKFKLPFIDSVKKYNNMLLTYDTAPRQVITSDKKKLIFDNNAQWRIENPALFEVSMGRVEEAQKRLDDILYSMMNEKVGKMDSNTLITDKDEVEKMQNDLAVQVSDTMKAYGISVFDIRVKRTDLPEENYDSVYKRMITERERIAAQFRSEGDEDALKARSDTDRQIMILLSEAKNKSETIKGEGDAQAAKIYNDAYGKDVGFYEFYNTLEAYKLTIKNNTKLVIPSDSPFAKYLFGNK
ncbi:MAG: protease modulator HflC [Saccharofermentanales bacterium]